MKISAQRLDLQGGRIDNAALKNYSEAVVGGASGTNSGSSYAIDLTLGSVFNLILNADCTLSFSGALTGAGSACVIILKQDSTGGRTVTWPSSVRWPGGVNAFAPVLTAAANRFDIITLTTPDAGSTWYGSVAGKNFA